MNLPTRTTRTAAHAFFCSWLVALLNLLSFPTRRSSDLVAADLRRAHRVGRVEDPLDDEGAWEIAAIAFEIADRKSTRLNSSHVATSYAVFCLKKLTAGRAITTSPMAPSFTMR